ncbi:ABC transporter permease [Microvirga massiliensis]|uniref:ABC transporter permease n=1 Tax=Microvirga massiliensis TaxID=1033741 RepID=UPI00164E12E5|nr:ABC transporter permease [Microvirga massiliensis]
MTSLSFTDELPRIDWHARVPLWVWLLGPYIVLLVGGLLLPVLYLGTISFLTYSPQSIWLMLPTAGNYARLLDTYYVEVVLRTLRIGAVTTVACLILGAPLAYWLARCSRRMLAVGLFLIVMPMMVSTVIRAFGWMILLGRNGLINQISVELGLGRWLFVMNTEAAVVIALVQICLPLMVLPTMAAVEKIPISLEEAATNLGAKPFQLFRRVVIPLAIPGLASGAVLSFVVAISVVITPALMGGRSNRMIGNEIYDQVITAMNWPFASAMAVVLIAIVIALMVFSLWVGRILDRRAVAATAGQG